MKRVRLLLAAAMVAGATMVVAAPPAHACFNPDEPVCKTYMAICNATEPYAKYRDRVMSCP